MSILRAITRRLAGPRTIEVGPATGLRFDPGPSNPDYASGDNEMPVQQCLREHLAQGRVLYDIGANVGFLSVVGAQLVGPSGAVYAFEPVPANARLIRRNATLNQLKQIEVLDMAVGEETGTARLLLARYSGGAVLAGADPPPDPAGEIDVRVDTVDNLVAQGLRPPSVVKIDVEGAELAVLHGMERTCEQVRPIIVYELDAADETAVEHKRLTADGWLERHEYEVTELPRSYPAGGWCVRHFVAVHR